jgi:hypothetical protein
MDDRIFDNEMEAVKWLAEKDFFSALSSETIQFERKYLTNVCLHKIKPGHCEKRLFPKCLSKIDIRNYVKAFEIDYIAIYERHDTYQYHLQQPLNLEPPPINKEDQKRYKCMGIEAKYFYETNLDNRKYHQGIGQFIEYLKWGLDFVTLVHIFDKNIGEGKINEFGKPACELFSLLQEIYELPLGYVGLIVDENKDLKRSLQNGYFCRKSLGSQKNPFKEKENTKKIRNSINEHIHQILKT